MFDYRAPDTTWLEGFDFDDLSLHSAILKRDGRRVSQLLGLVDVDQRLGSGNFTPLEVAVLVGDPEILRILLAHRNIRLRVTDLQNHADRVFHTRNNALVVFEFLKCEQIKPSKDWATYLLNLLKMERSTKTWINLFLVAFRCESDAWISFLLKQVDQIDQQEQKDQKYQEIRDKRPVEAFEYACKNDENKLIDFLVDYLQDDIEHYRNESGQTILHIAAIYGKEAAVDKVLDVYRDAIGSKLDINHVDDEGHTALSKMLRHGDTPELRDRYIKIIKMFLQLKADVNAGTTPPLLLAIDASYAYEDTRIIELLLEYPQTKIDTREMPGQYTALHVAARMGNTKVVELLLKSPKTPKLSLTDNDAHGDTALHKAVWTAVDPEEDEIVREKGRNTLKLLLQQEEKWNEVLHRANEKGFTPLDLAKNDDITLCLLKLKKEIKADDLAKLTEMKEFEDLKKIDAYKAIISPSNNASDAIKFMKIVDLFHEELKKLQPKAAKGTRDLEFLPKVDESKIEPEKYHQIRAALQKIQDEYCRINFLEVPRATLRAEM